MSANPLSITNEQINRSKTSISLIGDLTSEAQEGLAEQIEIINQGNYSELALELSRLKTIDGSGLKQLEIFLMKVIRSGISISIHGLSSGIKSIFELTYLNEIVKWNQTD